MKARNVNLKLSVLSVAMLGVFSSMCAYADDEEAAALMNPTSSVTVEEIYVSQGSQKFGEYNGLNKQGGYINGNINVRGGDGYKKNEAGDTVRWSIQGTDLGLTDRSASVGYSDQGNWGAKVGYDELQHNLAPGYQTPYQGGNGGNSFSLPSTFPQIDPKANAGLNTNVGTRYNGTNGLTSAMQSQFQNTDISSTRQNTSLNAEKILGDGLSVNFDFNHLNQTGAKLMGFGQASTDRNTAALVTNEAVSILPNPTNYQTDTVNLALNWGGEKARLTGSYFGSFFRDGNNGVNWQTWAGTGTTGQIQTMSTAPSNQLQQLNLGGGYDFTNKTKLVGSLSYGRNTQNTSSAYDSFMIPTGASPAPFNGLVNTAHADLKLNDSSIKNLNLSAGVKYDSRDNLSQSNIQQFYSIGNHNTFYPNTPLSYRKTQAEVAGDYRVTNDQKVRLAYTYTNLNRYCNQYATGTSTTSPGGSAPLTSYSSYPAGADCLTANNNRSNNLSALYRLKATEDVDFRLSYALDVRQASWNQSAIAAMYGGNANNAVTNSVTMLPGQNGGDYLGFQPFFEASRNQQLVKGRANWQATEALALGVGGKYTYDQFTDLTYGVKNANMWSVNFDANYNYAENASVVAYAVQQNGMRNLTNGYYSTTVNTGTGYNNGMGNWTNTMTQNDTTLGLGVRHNGLISGKVDLTGDATYSLGQTGYNTAINTPNTTPGSVYNCSLATNGTCGSPGAITNRMASLKLGATYKIDKSSKIGLRYIYQHLTSNDFYYNGLQTGYTPNTLLPTNQTSGSYNVNVIAASYTYMFD